MSGNYSSVDTQFPEFTLHHSPYAAIDTKTTLKGSAAGEVVFISGASQGIGQATAIAFAQAGAKAVYITARSEKGLKETKDKIEKENPNTQCAYRICNATKAAEVKAAVDDCVARFGGIDIADANAGSSGNWDKKIGDSDAASWWQTWEVNMKGAYHVVRFAIPHLVQSAGKNNGGHLILLSSIGAQMLMPGASDYQVSKHAVNRLCEFVNIDHGEEGIKCFAIHPGGVATELAKNNPSQIQAILIDNPVLAALFIFWLCSGKVDWATGRYLSSNWDVTELFGMKDKILAEDLFVNRLRVKS